MSSFAYDASGNTMTRDVAGEAAQSLSWDVEGELTKVTQTGEADASFVYTADGDRLLRRQGGATTVYLPGGQELTLTAGGATRATRYYTWAGQTIAVRTGTTFDDVSTLVNDHQGTASMSVTNVSAQISRRYQTPFGESRGAVPGSWSGDHGFLDKPADATGLTAVGARYYDPTLGRFISVDPVMDLTDPQQWHGYAYANNNPVTWSDPTGLRPEAGNGFRDTAAQKKASVRHMARNWTPPRPKPPVVIQPTGRSADRSGYAGGFTDNSVSGSNSNYPAKEATGRKKKLTQDEIEANQRYLAWQQQFRNEHPGWSGFLGVTDSIECREGDGGACLWQAANGALIGVGVFARSGLGARAATGGLAGERSAIAGSRLVKGKFPRTADKNAVLVRRGGDGRVTNYQVYDDGGLPVKRVDVTGRSHGGVETPHVVEYERHVSPTGEVFVRPGQNVRPATPEELMGLE
ncbi:RHS repeat-associated core domain-containing protein [Isoptericola sp. BMS4]|uniref:RHS repeat-associated core domain-containing protein n=1 Tax=Isoptericola sp. BMS4 TaxID=2527875 RepID=UPI00196A553D|nr:polymorphic toxin type 24 domain-containing protein [Isoptericola sp. BMS4]